MFRSPPQPMWDLIIHPPFGPSVLTSTRSLLQSMWDPSINPPLGQKSLLAHRLVSTPLWDSTSLMAHRVHSCPASVLQLVCTLVPQIELDHNFDLYMPLSLAWLSFKSTQCSTTSNMLIRVGLRFLASFRTFFALLKLF